MIGMSSADNSKMFGLIFQERFSLFLIDATETESREEWYSRQQRPCGVAPSWPSSFERHFGDHHDRCNLNPALRPCCPGCCRTTSKSRWQSQRHDRCGPKTRHAAQHSQHGRAESTIRIDPDRVFAGYRCSPPSLTRGNGNRRHAYILDAFRVQLGVE